jgi:hypothetical protein
MHPSNRTVKTVTTAALGGASSRLRSSPSLRRRPSLHRRDDPPSHLAGNIVASQSPGLNTLKSAKQRSYSVDPSELFCCAATPTGAL